ncbi:MAG: hypothetical protein E5V80_27100 [Mesorhizobium sp.]|nr:MAG: hypothetical protein E5V80_27100 [Mesorhizobium sp.]
MNVPETRQNRTRPRSQPRRSARRRRSRPRTEAPLISPLEGEMSPKATERVAAREAPTPFAMPDEVGASREMTPSGLPAISPSRGEIPHTPLSMMKFAKSISAILHERRFVPQASPGGRQAPAPVDLSGSCERLRSRRIGEARSR